MGSEHEVRGRGEQEERRRWWRRRRMERVGKVRGGGKERSEVTESEGRKEVDQVT